MAQQAPFTNRDAQRWGVCALIGCAALGAAVGVATRSWIAAWAVFTTPPAFAAIAGFVWLLRA